MKKNIAIIFMVMGSICLSSYVFTDALGDKMRAASFQWSHTTHDFGEIELNEAVTAKFSFQNTGNAPLVIVSAQGSCGCTVAGYTKGEIPAGEYGEVTATYTSSKAGLFNKTVTIKANTTDGPIVLTVKGEVIE